MKESLKGKKDLSVPSRWKGFDMDLLEKVLQFMKQMMYLL